MDHIVHLLAQYKYLLLFPLSIVEGPAITVIAGFLCAGGYMNPFIALPVISTGDVIGDTIYYSLGRAGKPLFLKQERLSRVRVYFPGPSPPDHIPVQGYSGGGRSRIVPGRKRPGPLCPLFGHLPGNFPGPNHEHFYLGIGFGFGQAYEQINRYLNETAAWIVVISLCLILWYGIRTMTRKL